MHVVRCVCEYVYKLINAKYITFAGILIKIFILKWRFPTCFDTRLTENHFKKKIYGYIHKNI